MNKFCTSIEQSKKLAEFLPLESADMYYSKDATYPKILTKYEITYANVLYGSYDIRYFNIFENTPAWSLAALLKVIPKKIKDFNVLRIDINEEDFAIWYDEIGYGVNTELPDITMECPVDACVTMIEKLHELKFL